MSSILILATIDKGDNMCKQEWFNPKPKDWRDFLKAGDLFISIDYSFYKNEYHTIGIVIGPNNTYHGFDIPNKEFSQCKETMDHINKCYHQALEDIKYSPMNIDIDENIGKFKHLKEVRFRTEVIYLLDYRPGVKDRFGWDKPKHKELSDLEEDIYRIGSLNKEENE